MLSRRVVAAALVMSVLVACTRGDAPDPGPTASTPARPGSPAGIGVPPPPPAILPIAHVPGTETTAAVGQPFPIVAVVVPAEPIVAVELHADTRLVEVHRFATPVTDPTQVFAWQPTAEGLAVLEIRAVGASGAVADATPLWVRVVDDPENPVAPALRPTPAATATPGGTAGGRAGVEIDVDSCTAIIPVPSDGRSAGYTVQGATVGSSRFAALDVIPAVGGEVAVPLAGGPVIVRVDGYDDTRTTASWRYLLDGDPACADGDWSGDLRLVDGRLVGTDDDVDATYLYVSTDDVTWSRLPVDDGVFVSRSPTGFDFTHLLGAHDSGTGELHVEAWGWRGTTLTPLGRTSYRPRPESGPWPIFPLTVIPASQLVLVHAVSGIDGAPPSEIVSETGALCGPGEISPAGCLSEPSLLRWSAIPDSTEAGLLQVSQLPFPAGLHLDVRGLLHAEMIALDGATKVDIPIDLRQVAGLNASAVDVGLTIDQTFAYTNLEVIQADLTTVAPGSAGGGLRRSGSPYSAAPLGPPQRLYVRVIPFLDAQPTGGVTNAVQIDIGGEKLVILPTTADIDVEVAIDLPRWGNPEFGRCVRVVANPFGSANPAPSGLSTPQVFYDRDHARARTYTATGAAARGLEVGATVCALGPKPPKKTLIDYVVDVVGFVTGAWDLYSDLWTMLQTKLVEGVVFVTGCQPTTVCTAVASTVLKAGMVALGAPPAIPKFTEVVAIAEGELVEVATTYVVEQSGLCPDGLTAQCQEIVGETVGWVLDQVKQQASQVALSKASGGGYTLFVNPAITVVTEPAGMVDFGFAEVTISRPTSGAPLPATTGCWITMEVEATAQLSWKEPNGTYHDELVTKRVVWASASVDLATIEPGGSRSVAVVATDFDRMQHLAGATQTQLKNAYDGMEAWRHLLNAPGATLQATVDVCGRVHTASGVMAGTIPSPELYPTPAA